MTNFAYAVWLVNMLCDTFGQLSFKKAATASGDGFERWLTMSQD